LPANGAGEKVRVNFPDSRDIRRNLGSQKACSRKSVTPLFGG
jgi:hypothetical protein